MTETPAVPAATIPVDLPAWATQVDGGLAEFVVESEHDLLMCHPDSDGLLEIWLRQHLYVEAVDTRLEWVHESGPRATEILLQPRPGADVVPLGADQAISLAACLLWHAAGAAQIDDGTALQRFHVAFQDLAAVYAGQVSE